jgi:hypothetical protein
MATSNLPPSGSGSNPQIHDVAPDVVTIGPDYGVDGVTFEILDQTANVAYLRSQEKTEPDQDYQTNAPHGVMILRSRITLATSRSATLLGLAMWAADDIRRQNPT